MLARLLIALFVVFMPAALLNSTKNDVHLLLQSDTDTDVLCATGNMNSFLFRRSIGTIFRARYWCGSWSLYIEHLRCSTADNKKTVTFISESLWNDSLSWLHSSDDISSTWFILTEANRLSCVRAPGYPRQFVHNPMMNAESLLDIKQGLVWNCTNSGDNSLMNSAVPEQSFPATQTWQLLRNQSFVLGCLFPKCTVAEPKIILDGLLFLGVNFSTVMVKQEHLIADMVKRRVDILFYNIVPDANRWRLLHFPRFFDHGRVLFYTVRKPSLRAGAFIREAPMAFFTILFLSMVTCALGFCLINYCSGRGLVNGIQDVVFVLVSTAMLFSYPVPERFQRVVAGRIMLFCWMAGGFSLAVYFQSLLTSSLSSGYVWEADDTIEKLYSRLASKKVLPCVLKGSYYDRLLRQSDDKHGIIGAMAAARRLSSNKASTVSNTTEDCMEKVLGGIHVFISHEKHQCFIAKHGNRLTSGKDTIHRLYASTPVRKDLPLRNSYGQLVARMFETGLLSNRMSLRIWNCSRIRDMQVSLVPYDASQFRRVYYLCCGAATIVFVVEVMIFRMFQNNINTVPC